MKLALRFLTIYDRNGRDGPTTLQYWEIDTQQWCDVPHLRVSESSLDEVACTEPGAETIFKFS